MQEETREKEIKNCLHKRSTLLCHEFMYFDETENPYAPDMLNGSRVRFKMWRTVREGEPYSLYTVKIPKKDAARFLAVMERLEKTMFLAGRNDYVEYSQKMFRPLAEK